MPTQSIWGKLRSSHNEIRLLKVQPSPTADDELSCSLLVVSLDDNPDYVALSYTWGDPSLTVPIVLNNQPWQVTSNLNDALRGLRQTSEPLTIFADALCINQQDLEEKSVQVMMMAQIFRQAKTVHCWIDRADEHSIRGSELFVQVGKGVVISDATIEGTSVDVADVESLVVFLGKPYWKRAWIIQEVAFASRALFHYGRHLFSQDDLPSVYDLFVSLRSLFKLIKKIGNDYRIFSRVIEACLQNLRGFLNSVTTLLKLHLYKTSVDMLVSMTEQEALLKQDHIYAFLGIFNSQLLEPIQPDYLIPVDRVFINFAYRYMQAANKSNLMHYAIGQDDNPLGLPSWVPDFSRTDQFRSPSIYCDNEQISPDFVLVNNSLLGVTGCWFDFIIAAKPVCEAGFSFRPALADAKKTAALHIEWRKFFGLETESDQLRPYVGGGTLEEAYWRVMCEDRIFIKELGKTRLLCQRDIDLMSKWLEQIVQQPEWKISTEMASVARCYNNQLYSLNPSRRAWVLSDPLLPRYMFRTARGYIGITNRATRPRIGDIIGLIAGLDEPTLLRIAKPNRPEERIYRLVTHAFVLGLVSKPILPEDATEELPGVFFTNYVHPHVAAAPSWNRIWLR